jgi:hypothetical protein
MSQLLNAHFVLCQIGRALPDKHHNDTVCIGSLTATISISIKSE